MKLTNARVTIQTTDTTQWLVTADGLIAGSDGLETINFTVLVSQSDRSMPAVTRQAVARAIQLLSMYQDLSAPRD